MQHLHDDTYAHIFKNVLYSTDPNSGIPLTNTLIGVDEVKLSVFGLNHRVCNVESRINETDTHVLDFRPDNATELWTLMRNVYNKWERLHEENGHKYWPCKSQAIDLVIDGSVDSLRSLQPTRFVTEKYKLALALLDLLCVLTSNYFENLLESHKNGDRFLEIHRQKVRKIECNAMKKALVFYHTFDPDRYKRAREKPDQYSYACRVKHLLDEVCKNDAHKLPANFHKQLFHFTISDVFTSHREHVHMLLCHSFLAEDPIHCERWLQLMLAIADNRLQVEDAQTRLIAEVKQWKRLYDTSERRGRKRRRENDNLENLTVDSQENQYESYSRVNGSDFTIQTVNRNEPGLRSVGNTGALYVRGMEND